MSVHLVQVDFQKKKKPFPMHHRSSVHQAAGKNRGKAFQEDSEHFKVDWERGITKSCLPSLDHGFPWNRPENLPYRAKS